MRKLRLIRRNQKISALLAGEMLFFLTNNRYSSSSEKAIRYALGHFDSLICLGQMQTELARAVVGTSERAPAIYTGHPLIETAADRAIQKLRTITQWKDITFYW